MGNKSNNLLYNTVTGHYFSYNFTDKPACYDASAHSWSNNESETTDPHYWHHNRYFNPADHTLYTFGGYGFHIYKNDIHQYDPKSGKWESVRQKGDTIPPRYLAGLGVADDQTLLLFSGYGSEKGDQELSPHNYYDLYSYHIETAEIKKYGN
ncbi:MAG: hypothetical protein LUE93_13240 [Bacteroides sp.]|nr:hypothetical protein [Bacteroides sp.]